MVFGKRLASLSWEDQHALCAWLHGSYIRGKAATGDVDMLVLAPPSCGDVDPAQLLHDLVTALTDEVTATHCGLPRQHPTSKSAWTDPSPHCCPEWDACSHMRRRLLLLPFEAQTDSPSTVYRSHDGTLGLVLEVH